MMSPSGSAPLAPLPAGLPQKPDPEAMTRPNPDMGLEPPKTGCMWCMAGSRLAMEKCLPNVLTRVDAALGRLEGRDFARHDFQSPPPPSP